MNKSKGFSIIVVIVVAVFFCFGGVIVGFATKLYIDDATIVLAPSSTPAQLATNVTQIIKTNAPLPTYTFYPTYSPFPTLQAVATTKAPQPTTIAVVEPAQRPTRTLLPTNSVAYIPPDVDIPVFTGKGDSILDVHFPEWGVIHIIGNSDSRYFSVESLSNSGETIDYIASSSEPYDGYRLIDLSTEKAARLKITAYGPWEITYFPSVYGFHPLIYPGKYQGTGDDVLLLIPANPKTKPDTAIITGNSAGRYFSINAYNEDGQNYLASSSDPYEGTVIIPPGTIIIEVDAVGSWTIEITSK
jgi:hypothetical protein